MKRYGGLFEDIISFENLLLAAKKALRGKKKKNAAAGFYFDLEKEIIKLREELISGDYTPAKYSVFTIYEPKKRKICACSFRDRVVHHAICNLIEPIFEKIFIYDNYACRKDKGVHKAVKRAQYFALKNTCFFKMDITKFFNSVDHVVLKNLILRKIKDKKLLELFNKIINQGVPDNFEGKGLPIGNLTSQYFANFYLNELDHFVKEKLEIKGYVRYMDDFLIFENEKQKLKEGFILMKDFLDSKLKLALKKSALLLGQVSFGIPFLGFRIFPKTIRLERKKWVRFTRRIKKLEKLYMAGAIEESKLNHSVESMIGHICHVNTLSARKKLFENSMSLG